jgi:hypothetical protein
MTAPHHRRRAADRPSPGSRAAAGSRASQGERVWRPRAATPQELDEARTVLVVHRLDPRTRRCAACAADCPCPSALDAGRVLAEAGAWNTVPFTGFTRRQTDQARTQAADGWVTRLVRRLPWAAAE